MTGTWVLELKLDRSEFRERPAAWQIRGMLTLGPAAPGDASPNLGPAPTHAGRVRLDLKPFGLGERTWENVGSTTIMGDVRIADVALALDGAGEVQILVNPVVSHGGLSLHGKWRAAEISGRWMVPGLVPMATGRFEMRREG